MIKQGLERALLDFFTYEDNCLDFFIFGSYIMEKRLPSLFIAVDGIDGTGKTSIAKHLCEKLAQYNYDVEYVSLLGVGELGQLLRNKILTGDLNSESESIYMAAAVLEALTKSIPEKLEQPNKAIVMDRYLSSYYAYQFKSLDHPLAGTVYAHCLKETYFDRLPDWYILTSCQPSIARERISQRKMVTEENNSFDYLDEQRKEKIRSAMASFYQKSVVNYKTSLVTDERLPLVKKIITCALKQFLIDFWRDRRVVG